MFGLDDTIVAISSPAGDAGRAIVRVSGPQAFALAAAAFGPRAGTLAEMPGFCAVDGLVRLPAPPIVLPARAYVFRAPRSYTRQDVVELHIPGPAAAATALEGFLAEAGARPARPGEFTARAFFAGRIDLSAAEAVADVIAAADDAQLRAAVAALGGRVHRLGRDAASRLTEALATVEASIDLAEEGIQLGSPAELAGRLAELADHLDGVADEAAVLPDTAARAQVVIAGRPNVGKSSLLNALTGTDRAIVSALAGTTRDVLRGSMALPDAPAVELLDAAGFARPDDTLEAAANSAARQAVASADAVLFVVDLTAEAADADASLLAEVRAENPGAPLVLLGSKADLVVSSRPAVLEGLARTAEAGGSEAIVTSAVTGEGLAAVREAIRQVLHLRAERPGGALGLHDRQRRCLRSCAAAARRAAELLRPLAEIADAAELAAVELREALGEIGTISGEVVTEDVLGRIFARFCVGK